MVSCVKTNLLLKAMLVESFFKLNEAKEVSHGCKHTLTNVVPWVVVS